MANTLKDALMKAGLRATQHENEREKRPKNEPTKKSVAHQERRNYCEVCNNVQPDVERYAHKNPLIDAQWICVACADKNMIEDRFRATHQSDFALRGLFRREYGPTRKAHEFDRSAPQKGGASAPQDKARHGGPINERGNEQRRDGHRDSNKDGNREGNRDSNRDKRGPKGPPHRR